MIMTPLHAMQWSGDVNYHIGCRKRKCETAELVHTAPAAVCRQVSFISCTGCPAGSPPFPVHDVRRKLGAKDDFGAKDDGVGLMVIEINLIWLT